MTQTVQYRLSPFKEIFCQFRFRMMIVEFVPGGSRYDVFFSFLGFFFHLCFFLLIFPTIIVTSFDASCSFWNRPNGCFWLLLLLLLLLYHISDYYQAHENKEEKFSANPFPITRQTQIIPLFALFGPVSAPSGSIFYIYIYTTVLGEGKV